MNIPFVVAVSSSSKHGFSKANKDSIRLIKGFGVAGDVHAGETVKHRSRVAQNPLQPNLRQIHLIHSELFDELSEKGFKVNFGQIGENVTTKGIDLLDLPKDTILQIGESAKIKVTGLRNPCWQLDNFQKGLMNALLDKSENGELIRKAGIMGVVIESGEIKIGDLIKIELPPKPFEKLQRV